MVDISIKKQTPKTHFIKFNTIFSVFIFIFFFSSTVSLCSYTHYFSSFDRHYIFLLCNGILVFLIMNFATTNSSSPKENHQSVIANEINHSPLLISPAMEEIIGEEEEEEKDDDDDEIERSGEEQDFVIEEQNAVFVSEYQFEELKEEIHFVVEQETEELNKRCAEFIRKMKQRIKSESFHHLK